jgi:hypothetical protein
MTPGGPEPTVEQLREDLELLRGELAQLAGQLARLDTRTETHARALDDIEAYVTETAQLARATAEHAAPPAASTTDAKASEGWTWARWCRGWKTTSPPSSPAKCPPLTAHPDGVPAGGTTPKRSPGWKLPGKRGWR